MRRIAIYGTTRMPELVLVAAAIAAAGGSPEFRHDGAFTDDQVEPFDAVVAREDVFTSAPIAAAYGSKNVPVCLVPLNATAEALGEHDEFQQLLAGIGTAPAAPEPQAMSPADLIAGSTPAPSAPPPLTLTPESATGDDGKGGKKAEKAKTGSST